MKVLNPGFGIIMSKTGGNDVQSVWAAILFFCVCVIRANKPIGGILLDFVKS